MRVGSESLKCSASIGVSSGILAQQANSLAVLQLISLAATVLHGGPMACEHPAAPAPFVCPCFEKRASIFMTETFRRANSDKAHGFGMGRPVSTLCNASDDVCLTHFTFFRSYSALGRFGVGFSFIQHSVLQLSSLCMF